MSKPLFLTGLAAGAALMGAGYLGRRNLARTQRLTGIIPIVTPYIDIETAEGVLAVMERLPEERVTIVLHTLGGCVTACVLIANALRQFRDSTAIVPYMAISGGTLIALSATRLEMGGRASLSAVDPQIMGQRVKHLAESKDKPSIAALAREYDVAMRKYVRARLSERLPEDRLGPAMDLLLGEQSPHEWPPAFTTDYVDGFMRRHRGEVHALVMKTLARRGAEGGEAPELLVDFLAYDVVAAAQRSVDAQPDPQVLRELWRQVDAQFAEGYNELSVFHNFAVEYIDARTEAIFLRAAGWDVVPLLLERPALAIVAGGHVVAVRDWRGWLKIHPERRGTLNHLFADLDRAEEKLLALRESLGLERNTKERLMKYATSTWKHARKEVQRLNPQPQPSPTRSKQGG